MRSMATNNKKNKKYNQYKLVTKSPRQHGCHRDGSFDAKAQRRYQKNRPDDELTVMLSLSEKRALDGAAVSAAVAVPVAPIFIIEMSAVGTIRTVSEKRT